MVTNCDHKQITFNTTAMAKAKRAVVKIIPDETIIRKVYILRGQKVLLDKDLADLFGVETKVFNQAVKRNMDRFPPDFMFQLNNKEFESLRSQFVTSNRGGSRYRPYAFTEQGVGMLTGIVNSPKAIEMHIAIVRAFVEMRKLAYTNHKLAQELKLVFDKLNGHDAQFAAIYEAMENLMDEKTEEKVKKISWEERERIGFKK